MKRITFIFACLWLSMIAQATVYTPTSLPNPKVQDRYSYVCNPDRIVNSSDILFLNRLAKQLEDSTMVELCIVAVSSIGNSNAFEFCYELFQRWGIGKEGKNTGVLIFLAVESRDIRIMTGGGIEGILTDAICNEIINTTMIPPLKEGDYSAGLALGALRIYEICTDGNVPEELRNITSATNRYHYADESEKNELKEVLYFIGIPFLFVILLIIPLLLIIIIRTTIKCPKCGKRGWHKTSEQIISRATTKKEGLGVRTYTCKHCGHHEDKSFVIPREVPMVFISGGGSHGGFGGGSFGGGFGGGSTFGGGAGGKF